MLKLARQSAQKALWQAELDRQNAIQALTAYLGIQKASK